MKRPRTSSRAYQPWAEEPAHALAPRNRGHIQDGCQHHSPGGTPSQTRIRDGSLHLVLPIIHIRQRPAEQETNDQSTGTTHRRQPRKSGDAGAILPGTQRDRPVGRSFEGSLRKQRRGSAHQAERTERRNNRTDIFQQSIQRPSDKLKSKTGHENGEQRPC